MTRIEIIFEVILSRMATFIELLTLQRQYDSQDHSRAVARLWGTYDKQLKKWSQITAKCTALDILKFINQVINYMELKVKFSYT